MADIELIEGTLTFKFKNVETAEKYDDWRHYRKTFNSACGSSKAVDFIVVKDDVAWFIEVKDYRQNVRTKPLDLAHEVMLKVRDTMAGLVSAAFIGVDHEEVTKSRAILKQKKDPCDTALGTTQKSESIISSFG